MQEDKRGAAPSLRLRTWREGTSGPNSLCCRLLEQLLACTKDAPTPLQCAQGVPSSSFANSSRLHKQGGRIYA